MFPHMKQHQFAVKMILPALGTREIVPVSPNDESHSGLLGGPLGLRQELSGSWGRGYGAEEPNN